MTNIIRIESITQVHDILGLEKPKHPLVTVLPLDEKINTYDYGDYKYTFDFYQISLKQGLRGTITYGRNSYDFQEGSMVFMKPDQAVKIESNEEDKDSTGWTLLFHPDLIRRSELGKNIENYSFFTYEVHEALHLSDKEKNSLTDLAKKIEDELDQNIDKHSQKLIVANIELILDYCTRYYDRQFYTRTNFNKDIVTKFNNLLKEYYSADKQMKQGVPNVKFCGEELNMSPNYLSDLLKKETGKNAQEHIHHFIIDRAKTQLLGSEESVSQIAYDLGFEYPQHFSKVFKSKTGFSPAEYRTLN